MRYEYRFHKCIYDHGKEITSPVQFSEGLNRGWVNSAYFVCEAESGKVLKQRLPVMNLQKDLDEYYERLRENCVDFVENSSKFDRENSYHSSIKNTLEWIKQTEEEIRIDTWFGEQPDILE
jgi:hypothetical protein